MLKAEKRHTRTCVARRRTKNQNAAEYDAHLRCTCSYRAVGMLDGRLVRKSLKTSDYEKAVKIIHRWEGCGQSGDVQARSITVEEAVRGFLDDAKARNLESATQAKLKTIFERQLLEFCQNRGFPILRQIASVSVVRDFRATWKDAPLARAKKQERVVSFFYFCERTGWLERNPVTTRALGRIRVEQRPTDYFTPEEFDAIIKATESYKGNRWEQGVTGTQLRALTLLMRWTGLRIRDSVTLERCRLTKTDRGGDCILLYQAKTGEPVYCPIPPHVVQALESLPKMASGNPRYFFWSGQGYPNTAAGNWRRSYRRLFKLTELKKRAFPHMFRDTFAVECLRAGVSLERVSTLLGHRSIKITEKHYKPHVKALQWELEDEVSKSWSPMPNKTNTA